MRSNLCISLALLFLACGVFTNAQNAEETRVVVKEGAPLTIECSLRVEHRAEWHLSGRAIPTDMRMMGETAAGGRLTAKLHASSARPHHAGVYTCSEEPVQRVRVIVEPAPTPATPDTEPAPETTPEPTTLLSNYEKLNYTVGRPFTLNCTMAVKLDNFEIEWKKNNTVISEVAMLKDRHELSKDGTTFSIKGRSTEEDFGNYTCALKGQEGPIRSWMVVGTVHAKMPKDANVVEGQDIKLSCKVIGKPYPEVSWLYKADPDPAANGTVIESTPENRISFETNDQGINDTVLIIKRAERTDAGVYICAPVDGTKAEITLRVKGVYDALWPFLGICAEVIVLCAVILFYEKRRTKPELDDSDTDNHDQKKS